MEAGRRQTAQANLLVLGRRVRQLREERGLSQEALAHQAGLHRAVVGFVERGERDIGVTHLWPIAEALGVPVADLFGDD
jgi:transcriptional regulator with XRE-family HTH domain